MVTFFSHFTEIPPPTRSTWAKQTSSWEVSTQFSVYPDEMILLRNENLDLENIRKRGIKGKERKKIRDFRHLERIRFWWYVGEIKATDRDQICSSTSIRALKKEKEKKKKKVRNRFSSFCFLKVPFGRDVKTGFFWQLTRSILLRRKETALVFFPLKRICPMNFKKNDF